MKIVICGANGQLGRALQASLDGQSVTALARSQLDITDLENARQAFNTIKPDLVINAAAFNEVDRAESDPEPAFKHNALGPRNLALATSAIGIPIVHVSTDYVFDGNGSRPYHEFDQTGPHSVYGASKLAGERAVAIHNPRHYIVRTAWLYDATSRNFPNTMIGFATRPEVRVVDDQTGSPTFVPHLARGIARLIESDAYGTYHLAGLGGASWFELTRSLFSLLGIDTPVIPVSTEEFPRPAPRPRYSVLTTMQHPRILLPPWEQGLKEFAEEKKRGTH